ncbi:Tol-Pal system beta propeller repeat protein TolB [Wohlfahrtiimonas sp. G9077]|uniref:Tol-Pal system beta propeller repeat protein TolB n=1 Tax=Wohlfahrtiimonas sp. G9077 TaxID=1980118 RepID=UPI000B9895D5|nr:Tol-Pal system beta propeller repeat protein TolB [Wohlfahrtiimonas sp. G9077]OYQ72731.1 Tol-Pal system beta propeller repeat protein TolB [Wohlfahrtiimonas sp. G9077]
MKKHVVKLSFWLFFSLLSLITFSHAQLKIQVTKSASNAIPIVLYSNDQLGNFVEQVAGGDLARSGRFIALPSKNSPEPTAGPAAINSEAWMQRGVQYAVFLTVRGNQISVDLVNTFSKQSMLQRVYTVGANNERQWRKTAHQVADAIYEKILGVKGSFDTKVAYVAKNGRQYQLIVSDADGAYPSTIFNSNEPILSPSWSPDGRSIAYSSLEGKKSKIVVQDVYSGKRHVVLDLPGINGAPSWSPDGSRLVFTLSKDGNPEIYTSDIYGKGLTRLTNHASIDTEPVWGKDNMIYFTSDRTGAPQIYRMSPNGGTPTRVSTSGNYNASPSISNDGRYLAVMNRGSGGNGFGIAIIDLQTGATKRLTNGGKDEAPSFSSNGHMIIYANGVGGLNAVSNDGSVTQKFSSNASDVREPAWSN